MAYWQAGAAVLGAYGSYAGQSSANSANIGLNRANRDWQERMSNTAYQRSAKDLEKAGLNRILALGGPASSPQNASPQVQNSLKDAAPHATAAALAVAQKENIEAQTQKTRAETIGVHQMNDIKSTGSSVGKDANKLYNAGKDIVEKEAPNAYQKAVDWTSDKMTKTSNFFENLSTKAQIQELKNKKFTDNTKRWYKLSNGKWYDLKNHKVVEIRSK